MAYEPEFRNRSTNWRLTRVQKADAFTTAFMGAEEFKRTRGAYGGNDFDRHYTGKLGEYAAHGWFKARGHKTIALFRTGARAQADLRVGALRVEVKAWRNRYWDRFGRSLAAVQLERIKAKADIVLWCRVPDTPRPDDVRLEGWSHVADVIERGVPRWRRDLRADLQLPDDLLRPISAFEDPNVLPPRATVLVPNKDFTCGHERLLGHCWGCVTQPDGAPGLVMVSEGTGSNFHCSRGQDVSAAHQGWPFRSDTAVVPLSTAALTCLACPYCFPNL